MKTGNVVVGIIGGLLTGAALGILFAPDKGTKTRKKILNKTKKTKKQLKNGFDNYVDSISEKYNSVINTGKDLLESGRDEIKDLKSTFNK